MPRDTIIDCTFCCPAGRGWFTNDEVGTIERCDECRRFINDDAAADYVRATLDTCDECEEAFTSYGKCQRSLLNPALCEACLCAC